MKISLSYRTGPLFVRKPLIMLIGFRTLNLDSGFCFVFTGKFVLIITQPSTLFRKLPTFESIFYTCTNSDCIMILGRLVNFPSLQKSI